MGTIPCLLIVWEQERPFEMIAAAMESKRLGLCQKSLFVVPEPFDGTVGE